MNLDSIVKCGRLPWRPRPEVSALDVWHQYEIPLTGTFRYQGELFLFTQVVDSDSDLSIWAYLHIPADEAERYTDVRFESVEELFRFTEDAFSGREAVLVLARANRIEEWTRSQVDDGLLAAAEALLDAVIAQSRRVDRVQAKFAGLDAATQSELASA